ncbi:DUF1330 domain-containing protein [Pseudoalteromonas luteoviolacea]|uniref:DUF1330 domain-containing protein n=1 Tax=Pseudoalteromonas luteoviolacea NCIMB 1942 TaxID=1365253 RepID=A0A167F263_9GAMM|nr:DUF1330 domain-containing protein [Pseudoalteromonas luteoviolacea]KZN51547.1 hypothetical protein N482_25155 [Pseudoalteromonas luteoviolacea NCIMB 1942]
MAKLEMLVGLYVKSDELYLEYRKAMTPILRRIGGDFGYDFVVGEVLKKETNNDINRVFTIHFPNKETMDTFFINEEYLAIKEKYYKPAVEHTTIIRSYEIVE